MLRTDKRGNNFAKSGKLLREESHNEARSILVLPYIQVKRDNEAHRALLYSLHPERCNSSLSSLPLFAKLLPLLSVLSIT